MALMGNQTESSVVDDWLTSVREYGLQTGETNQAITKDVGGKLVEAVVDFKRGHYAKVVQVRSNLILVFIPRPQARKATTERTCYCRKWSPVGIKSSMWEAAMLREMFTTSS